ncbi:MAG: hypothetical protein ACKOSS_04425 [Planctomycetia bacterium]
MDPVVEAAVPAVPGPDATAAAPRLPWRKRHPHRARLLLYGLLLGVLLASAWLWRDARQRYLWARLEQVSVLLAMDASGASARQVLDDEFRAYGALEALLQDRDLRAREQRMRAVIAFLVQDRATMEQAFTRAAALDPGHARLTAVERASCLVRLGDAEAASAALPQPLHVAGEGWAQTIWALLVHAQAQDIRGGGAASRAALAAALASLPRPLPQEAPMWLGLAPFTPSGAALEATRWLVSGPDPASDARRTEVRALWRQLAAVAGGDVEVLLAAAAELEALGDLAAARAALERASALDPGGVERALQSQPRLEALRAR